MKKVYFFYIIVFVSAIIGGIVSGKMLLDYVASKNELVAFIVVGNNLINFFVTCITTLIFLMLAFIIVMENQDQREQMQIKQKYK